MDARVLAVRDHVENLEEHTHRPTETVVKYENPPDTYETYPTPTLWKELCFNGFKDVSAIQPKEVKEIETRYFFTLIELGPYAADCYLIAHLKKRITNLLLTSRTMRHDSPQKPSSNDRDITTQILSNLSAVLEKHHVRFHGIPDLAAPPLEWMSPKILALTDVISKHRSAGFNGIVFVEQRQIAYALATILPCLPALKDWVSCAALVGHGEGRGNTEVGGMGFKKQDEVVKAFRDGHYNLVIATSVAEEGQRPIYVR